MKLAVPFFQQKLEYTCGPTALEMVFKFYGQGLSNSAIAKLALTTPQTGTSRKGMVKAARLAGFHTHAHHDGSMLEVKKYLSKGIPVIVNYRDLRGNEGHYGVIVGFIDKKILLHDPYEQKPFLAIDEKVFTDRWHGYHVSKNRHWLLALSSRPFAEQHS